MALVNLISNAVKYSRPREEKDMIDSYKLGVNGYVVKPVNFEEFFQAVEKLGVYWAFLNIPLPRDLLR